MSHNIRRHWSITSQKGPASYVALALAGAVGFAGSPAQAQEGGAPPAGAPAASSADTADAATLQEVIVTAQFRAQSLQRTPLAITAVNAAMLEDRGITDVSEVSAIAPSVTLEKGSGLNTNAAQFYIRGVGQYDIVPAVDPGVGVYVDDVYFGSTYGANFDLLDLDRVEVLRGPQATLAGFNSIGGAVKLYSQKPTGSGEGYLQAGYGSNDKRDVRGAVDLTVVPDNLFLRLSFASVGDNGYIDRLDFACAQPALAGTLPKQNPAVRGCVLGREGGVNDNSIRGALRWLATDRLEINFSADVELDTSQPSANTLIALNPAVIPAGWQAQQRARFGVVADSRFIPGKGQYISYDGFTDPVLGYTLDPNGHDRAYGFQGTLDYKVSDDISLKLISAYRTTDGYLAADVDGSPLGATGGTYSIDYHQFSQEARLNGSAFNSFLDYTVGGFYFDSHQTFDQFVDGPEGLFFLPGGLTKIGFDRVTERSYAGYTTLTLHPTSELSIIGGYRFTHTSKAYIFDDTGLYSPLLNVIGEGPPSVSNRSDYRGSIQYQWTPELMTYLQYSTGFKAGGINPTPTTVALALPFGPETLSSYEVGVKSAWFDRHLQVDLAGFTSRYNGFQMDAFQPDGSSIYTNAGNARITGAEAEIEARPIQGLLFSGSFSYLQYKWLYINDSPVPGVPDLQGPCLSCTNLYTPTYKANLGVQYTIELGSFGSLTPRFDDDYVSRMFSDPQNTLSTSMPQRWVANLRFTWRAPKSDWEASLAITNLFDKFYYQNTNAAEFSETGFASAVLGRPREALFTIRRSF